MPQRRVPGKSKTNKKYRDYEKEKHPDGGADDGIANMMSCTDAPQGEEFVIEGKLIGKQVGYSKGFLFKFVKETIVEHKKVWKRIKTRKRCGNLSLN